MAEQAMAPGVEGLVKGAGETLLVVEDDDSLRRLVVRILTRNGYDVVETASAREALAICEMHGGTIDLLVTDVNMPEMAGNELARRVSESHPGIRTLFMSGAADDPITRHGVLEPGEGFVQKPFSVEQLLQKISHALLY